ncbi:amidohydrolase family protein [bacterium]|nr:amidohydrolase family protein [bacterium]
MMKSQSQVLSARWVVPVTSEPIHGGWVQIEDGKVVAIGSGSPPGPSKDLGDVAVLPGLVNAHTHLEFSDCSETIGIPGISLPEWIGQVVSTRQASDQIGRSQAINSGLEELAHTGSCLVGEITTLPCEYPVDTCGVDLVSFAEVLGLSSERGTERLKLATTHLGLDPGSGVSPHAPYSTSLETLDACLQLANTKHRVLAMHVAESPYERELLQAGTGPFAEALQSLGVWRDNLFPWSENPFLMLIEKLAQAPRSLLIHANDLNESEITKLAKFPQMTVVYCPRTHYFFEYGPHPVAEMLSRGVRVALGTDSKASNPDLNLWSEAQFLWRHRVDIDPQAILQMATWSGSEALGRSDLGCIRPGSLAKLGLVRSSASTVDGLFNDFATSGYEPLWKFAD